MTKKKNKAKKVKKSPVYVNDCVRVELDENIGNNDGLLRKFLQFKIDNEIFGFRAGFSGMGKHVGFYYMEDKDKIVNFLEKEVNL